MEWTKTFVVSTRTAERDKLAHNIYDVGGSHYSIYGTSVNHCIGLMVCPYVVCLDNSDDFVDVFYSVVVAPFVDAINHLNGHSRINEISCTYLYGSCSTHYKLNGVFGIHYTP